MARRKRFKKNQPFKWKHYRPPSSEVQHSVESSYSYR
ncbi:hypothetical protein KW89_1p9 (plasmid) [Piscirickettsia salmonis]|nr:hypothetical protein KW89_1p9 [Piscirickettsia salmonis]